MFSDVPFVIFPSSEITYHWHVMSSMLERWGGTLHYNRQAIHLPLWVIVTKLRADLIKCSCVTQPDSERNAWSGECQCDIFWRKGRFCRVLDGTSCHQGPEGPPGLWGLISGWGHRDARHSSPRYNIKAQIQGLFEKGEENVQNSMNTNMRAQYQYKSYLGWYVLNRVRTLYVALLGCPAPRI